jgi:hypothetical protein
LKDGGNTFAKYAVRYSPGRQNKYFVPIPFAKLSELTIVKQKKDKGFFNREPAQGTQTPKTKGLQTMSYILTMRTPRNDMFTNRYTGDIEHKSA